MSFNNRMPLGLHGRQKHLCLIVPFILVEQRFERRNQTTSTESGVRGLYWQKNVLWLVEFDELAMVFLDSFRLASNSYRA